MTRNYQISDWQGLCYVGPVYETQNVQSDLHRCMADEVADPNAVSFPCRWPGARHLSPAEASAEIESLAIVLNKGCEAIAGVYMRLCDTIRSNHLTDRDVRSALRQHFPESRISEILRVSRAPDDVYMKYTAGFFGFRAALRQCRYYHVTPSEHLKWRKARRAAEMLVRLFDEPKTIRVKDRIITVT